jgi:hypothetical protein
MHRFIIHATPTTSVEMAVLTALSPPSPGDQEFLYWLGGGGVFRK